MKAVPARPKPDPAKHVILVDGVGRAVFFPCDRQFTLIVYAGHEFQRTTAFEDGYSVYRIVKFHPWPRIRHISRHLVDAPPPPQKEAATS